MEEEIARFIGLLDDDSVTVAEDAKAGLASLGSVVLAPLADAVRSLQPYGQLSAIEIFEELAEPAAEPALIGLLASASSTVREWAAWALHDLGGPDALVPLNEAYLRHRAEGHDPDHGEAVAHRRALTALGGRAELMPPLTAALRTGIGNLERVWPVTRLAEVIDELAAYGQAVLFFQTWTVTDKGIFGLGDERFDNPIDYTRPWPDIVAATCGRALDQASRATPRDNVFASIEWIDEADL